MPPISNYELDTAVEQFNRICVLEMQIEAAKKLLAKYMAAVPLHLRDDYIERTKVIQERYHQLKRET